MDNGNTDYVAPWSRVAILAGTLLAGGFLSWLLTGHIVPTEPRQSVIFQSGLLLVVLGSAVIEHKFTRPADSVVNSLTGIVALITVYAPAPKLAWWLVFGYCALVFLLSIACTVASTGPDAAGWQANLAAKTFDPSVKLGQSRLLHSIVFLFGVFAFYGTGTHTTAILVCFWGFFMAIWPLRLPQFLSGLRSRASTPAALGQVVRREWPNLVRVELRANVEWTQQRAALYQDADGTQHLVVPLYKQVRDQEALATGLLVPYSGEKVDGFRSGYVYEHAADPAATQELITETLGASSASHLIGLVIEDSRIGSIRFETWREDMCREGLLVWCTVAGDKVYYQITEGLTREESLESDRLGSQLAVSAQMGRLEEGKGFVKSDWLPTMNTPVFAEEETFGADQSAAISGDFVYGTVPGTSLEVGGPFVDSLDFHTAILGVTGSGKTELAFDLIRHSVDREVKVICIDLTARYAGRLDDLDPQNLSIADETADDLGQKLLAVETGTYGAGAEKEALNSLREQMYADVSEKIKAFLSTKDDANRVGLITLDEISNTKATLFITELYMTCLLRYARANADCPQTLVVVEEAHTVMPETATMGLGDYDSRGLVSKISQIALQGRKYGVGLLVVAQRTATVSKTVLTQCNTIISLNCFDETTTGFLSNVFGRPHAEAIRDLPHLHAVVFGKGVRSERPIIVEIPFDPKKEQS